jgi:hypothetical protein
MDWKAKFDNIKDKVKSQLSAKGLDNLNLVVDYMQVTNHS